MDSGWWAMCGLVLDTIARLAESCERSEEKKEGQFDRIKKLINLEKHFRTVRAWAVCKEEKTISPD